MTRKNMRRLGGVMMALAAVTFIVLITAAVNAQEVSSVRDSQYEWWCETEAGVFISGHTRQDKAFQSCFNQALATGNKHFVRGGTYRVTATGGVVPPTEPPVEPPPDPPVEPPPEPPPDDFLVSFGPITGLIEYPASISALSQELFRWEITFTLNSVAGIQGLASRDQSGQDEAGHLSVWIENQSINVRHQDIAGGHASVKITSGLITANREYKVTVSIERGVGIGLFVDGVLVGSDPWAAGTTGNNLPLIVGGLCTRCQADGSQGPDRPIDGTVYMEIWDDPLVLPAPVVGEVMLNWINPTEYENGEALPNGIPDRISVYGVPGPESTAVSKSLIANLDGESIAYEVTAVPAGTSCFAVTAWHLPSESQDSNTVCKVVE